MKIKHDFAKFFGNIKEKFNYKEYKKILEKDLVKLDRVQGDLSLLEEGDDIENGAAFYLSLKHSFTDKAGKDFPLIIIGKAQGDYKNKFREDIKTDKKHHIIGTCILTESPEGKLLELNIEKGNAKPKIIKKLCEKWLLPDNIKIGFSKESLIEDDDDGEDVDGEGFVKKIENNPSSVGRLQINTKVIEAYNAYTSGQLNRNQLKKEQIRSQILNFTEAFLAKFETYSPADKALNNDLLQTYQKILRELGRSDQEETNYEKLKEEKLDEESFSIISVEDLKKTAGGTSWGFSKSTYDKILDVLANYHTLKDKNAKKSCLKQIEQLIIEWEGKHPENKRKKDDIAKFSALESLRKNIKVLTSEQTNSAAINKGIEPVQMPLSDSSSISNEPAGTSRATEIVKKVAEASIDQRSIELARLLQQGKASNNDTNFGAIAKWLVDNNERQLTQKYELASVQLFSNKSFLISDLVRVFGAQSLRTKYLMDLLTNKENPYSSIACSLGLLGNTWFSTNEDKDAIEIVKKSLTESQINLLLDPKTAKQSNTFEGAIARTIQSDSKLLNVIKSISLQKSSRDNTETTRELEAIKKNNKLSYSYKSPADYYLCSTFEKHDSWNKFDKKKFVADLKTWVKTSTKDDRDIILNPNSGFCNLLKSKNGLILGISDSDEAFFKSIISTFSDNTTNSSPAVEEMMQIAAKQEKKSAFNKWRRDKVVGEKFKTALFNNASESPQNAVIKKFCSEDELNEFNNESTSKEKKAQILEKAIMALDGVMTKASVHEDKAGEILEIIYSNGLKGEHYFKVKEITTSLTGIGAADDFMNVIDKIPADSIEIKGIRNDLALLKSIKKIALDGKFKTNEDKEKWKTAITKLGLPPSAEEMEAAEKLVVDNIDSEEARNRYNLLAELKTLTENFDIPFVENTDNSKSPKTYSSGAKRISRTKIVSAEQIAAIKKEEINQRETPGYWASKLVNEYKKGFIGSSDKKLVSIAYQMSLTGVNPDDVKDLIKEVSPHLFNDIDNPSSFDLGDSGKKIKLIFKKNKFTPKEILQHAQNDSLLKRKRDVNTGDLTMIIDDIDIKTLMQEWFDIEALRNNIESKKVIIQEHNTLSNKPNKSLDEYKALRTLENKLEKVNNSILRFDIKSDIIDDLDDIAKNKTLIEFKKVLRLKFSVAVKDKAKIATLSTALGIPESDLAIIGASLSSISTLESEVSAETGVQWSSLSSRMLQRDLAAAKHLKTGWKGRETIKSISKLTPEQRIEEEQKFARKLEESRLELAEAVTKFQETKNLYDERVKTIAKILVTAIITAATAGIGAAPSAIFLKLAIASASGLFTTTVNNSVDKILSGNNYDNSTAEIILDIAKTQLKKLFFLGLDYALDGLDIVSFLQNEMTGEGEEFSLNDLKNLGAAIKKSPEVFEIDKNKFVENIIDYTKPSTIDTVISSVSTVGTNALYQIIVHNLADSGLSEKSKNYLENKINSNEQLNESPESVEIYLENFRSTEFVKRLTALSSFINLPIDQLAEKLANYAIDKIVNFKGLDLVNNEDLQIWRTKVIENVNFVLEKLKKELSDNVTKIPPTEPGNITLANVGELSLERMFSLREIIPIERPVIDFKDYIEESYPDLEHWELFNDLCLKNKALTLKNCAVEYESFITIIDDKSFLTDLITEKYKSGYAIPATAPLNQESTKNLDLNKSISDLYTEWKGIQTEIETANKLNKAE
jgi:hypothetical protein